MATYQRYPLGHQFFSNTPDASGHRVPLAGGKLYYYEAGTTDLVDTYADPDGLVANANPITLNANGRLDAPVYLSDAQDYKERLETSAGVLVAPWPQDDIPAAETPAESAASAVALFQWVTKNSNETLTASTFVGKALNGATGSGSITLTLPSAVSVGNGVGGVIKKGSASNSLVIDTQSAQTLDGASSLTLTANNHAVYIVSDGANWRVAASYKPAGSIVASDFAATLITALTELTAIDRTADFFLIWDASAGDFRKIASKFISVKNEPDSLHTLVVLDKDLTAPPGGPSEGDRYIVGAGATGAWTSQDGKVASYFNGAWAFYTPAEGWLVFVADEDVYYRYTGSAWVDLIVNLTEIGLTDGFGGSVKMKRIVQQTTLSGATADAATGLPVGIVLAVASRVTTAITFGGGGSSWSLGDGSTANKFGGSLGASLGQTNRGHIGPTGYYSGTDPLRFTPDSGSFAGGVVRTVIYYLEFTPPTS